MFVPGTGRGRDCIGASGRGSQTEVVREATTEGKQLNCMGLFDGWGGVTGRRTALWERTNIESLHLDSDPSNS